jgi:hypothetical protein
LNILRNMFVVCLFAAVASAQFNTNMETNVVAWQQCILSACNPGGSGIPTSTTIAQTGSKWPPNSLELSVTGPEWTDFLAYDKVGATTAAYFQSDFWVYIPTGTAFENYQALEYDIFEFLSPYEFMWGSQCVIGNMWQVWDELHQQWMNSPLACSLTAGRWYHLQWWVHRVDGDTSCDGYPCMYYDMLGIDEVYTQFTMTEPSGPIPAGWSDDSGLNFQLDISGVKGKVAAAEYLQHVNLIELGN